MKKIILSLFLSLSFLITSAQTCIDTVTFDNMETFDWFGDWFTPAATTGFFNNASVSPNVSAVIYGTGNGSSVAEQDWYVMPTINGLNPLSTYRFSFRLGSYVFSSPSATTRGADNADFIEVQMSRNGSAFFAEMRIRGFSGSFWDYNTLGVASKTANGATTTFAPIAGGNRTLTGDGFSVIQLVIPPGSNDLAFDIFCRVNSAGEEWWIDNVLLEEIYDCTILPIDLIDFGAKYNSSEKNVKVEWSANITYTDEHFVIQRSKDGVEFDSIGIIYPNEVGTNYFEFIDNSPYYNGISYYRLKMIERDNYHFSNLSAIEVDGYNNEISLYPNPFNENIKVQNLGEYKGICSISIYDALGKLVLQKTIDFNLESKYEIDTKILTSGFYTVEMKTDQITKSSKLRK